MYVHVHVHVDAQYYSIIQCIINYQYELQIIWCVYNINVYSMEPLYCGHTLHCDRSKCPDCRGVLVSEIVLCIKDSKLS